MPVEIRELVIRTVVDAGPAQEDGGEDAFSVVRPQAPDVAVIQAIVQECVKQVMRILDSRRDR